MLKKTFDCNNCTKANVCKYKEVETPEIITKVETKINNEYCPPIINFIVCCEESQKTFLTSK